MLAGGPARSPRATSRSPPRPTTRARRAPAPARRHSRHRRRIGRPGRRRSAPRRSSPPTISPSPASSSRRGGEPIDLGIALDERSALARSLARRAGGEGRRAGDARRRLGRRLRSGAEGARRGRHGARLLAHRHAARQAADAWPSRRDERSRPARQSRPLRRSARCCSSGRCCARWSATRGGRRPERTGAPRRRPARQWRAPGLSCAPQLARDGDGVLLASAVQKQDSSLVKTLARADALVVRPPYAPPAEAGEACRIIRFAALGA